MFYATAWLEHQTGPPVYKSKALEYVKVKIIFTIPKNTHVFWSAFVI